MSDAPATPLTGRMLHVCQPVEGGATGVALSLVRAGATAGYDVTLVTPVSPEIGAAVTAVGGRWVPVAMTRTPSLTSLRGLRPIRRLLTETDLVVMHSSAAGALVRVALASLPRHRRPRAVFIPHAWSWYVGGRLAPAYRWVERRLAHVGDLIVAVSDTEKADGRDVLGPDAAITVIPNGIDTHHFQPAVSGSSPTAKPALLVCVGRLSEQKGQSVLVQALARMRDRRARLRLVGDGPDRDRLVHLAREVGVIDRVDLIGADDPLAHYLAADIVVVPSRWEGFPLTVIEAMATGATVVATPAAAEALHGVGVVVPDNDSDVLAAALDELIADPERRRQLGADARRRATADYDMTVMHERHLRLWRDLLADAPRT